MRACARRGVLISNPHELIRQCQCTYSRMARVSDAEELIPPVLSNSMSANRPSSIGATGRGGNGSISTINPSSPTTETYNQPRWKPSVFDFKKTGGVCPTCKGTGRIPKGQEDELVALIPYNDKRLRPQRTWLYVIIVVVIVAIIGGLLAAFLVPCSINVTISRLNSTNNWISLHNDSSTYILEVVTTVLVKNSDFFPLQVNTLNNTLIHIDSAVGEFKVPPFSVSARSTKTVNVTQNATFSGSLARNVRILCTDEGGSHYIYLNAQVAVDYTYLSYRSDSIASKFDYINCDIVHSPDEADYRNGSCT